LEKTNDLVKQSLPVKETNTDFEVRSLDSMCMNESPVERPWWHNWQYLAAGVFFGIILVKSEVISWFRIREMFLVQSFHMYGVLGSGVIVGIVSVWGIKKYKFKTRYGERVIIHPKQFNKGQVYGGLLFGFGWALTGACPGPLFALIGSGVTVVIITFLSALAGTWVYGLLREKLPH